jgi:hypothetical protein
MNAWAFQCSTMAHVHPASRRILSDLWVLLTTGCFFNFLRHARIPVKLAHPAITLT